MKKYLLTMLLAFTFSVAAFAQTDIIVLNDGTVLNVYNLDYSPADKCYYTLDEAGEQMKSVPKADVMIIKLANGTKIDPNATTVAAPTKEDNSVKNPAAHDPVTYTAIEDKFLEKEVDWKKDLKNYLFFNYYKKHGGKVDVCNEKYILVSNRENQVLNMRLVSEKDKTLAVARPRPKEKMNKKGKLKVKEGKYEYSSIVLPEYVMIGNDKYTVTEIDPAAFISHPNVNEIVWPETLKSIGTAAFWGCNLKKIILPESLEKIEAVAFYYAGGKVFEQLYIPKNVKDIGVGAFQMLGPNKSYRGFYQGNLTCIPDFIGTGNCKDYGIDEEAVEAYERRKK